MSVLIGVATILLAILAARGRRWAYVLFIVLGLAYFPLQVGFRLNPRACQLVFDKDLALFSLTNYAHIILFAIFFLISTVQFARYEWAQANKLLAAAGATVVMGALVELAQGLSGHHNCRVRDLIPDSAGAVLGAVIVMSWHALKRKQVPGQRGSPPVA
jgi:hypothetical protein